MLAEHLAVATVLSCVVLGAVCCGARAGEQPGAAGSDLPLVFQDDLETGAERWEPLGEGNACWKVEKTDKGQSFHQFKNYGKSIGKHRSPFNIALVKDLVLEDFVFEADVKSTRKNYAHRDVCFFFGFQDPDHFHYVHFGLKTDNVSNRVMVVNDAPRKSVGEPISEGTPWTDDWHRLKVVFDAARAAVTVYFDDMTRPHMKAEGLAFTWGRIGIGSFDDTGMWDNVRIRGKVRTATGRTGAAAAPAGRLRVLILSGSNNHNWRETTPVLEKILTGTGRFDVTVTEHPETLTPKDLAACDVILSNWNVRRVREPRPWPDELKRAYVDFIRGGKGHVMVHAGSSSLYDWPEYQELSVATWTNGQTNHGPVHEFEVRLTPAEHPIAKGLASFKTTDELWNRPGVQEGARVLAESFSSAEKGGTGQWEPTAIVRPFGKGRCFALLLGHDARAMQNPGFCALLARGTEWAASGKVTIRPAAPEEGGTR